MISTRRALIAAIVFLSTASAVLTQEPPLDRTAGEQATGAEVGEVAISIGGVVHEIAFQANEAGDALYQGDIVLGSVDAMQAADGVSLQDLDEDILFGLALRNRDARWPDGIVRYRINPDLEMPERVHSAIAEWEAMTSISFTEISTTDGNYVEFMPGSGCSSAVGMVGGRQKITLGTSCGIGNAIHEIGHALGLHHEQARGDRGQHVVVLTENIEPGRAGNFSRDPTNFEDIDDYCYDSIMHYGEFAFSIQPNVLPTLETIPAGIAIGQRSGLAPCDVATIEQIYEVADDPVVAAFVGDVELFPEGCQASRKCYLRNDLVFTDPANVMWKAGKWIEGSPEAVETGITDGASIPDWAQPIIGDPYNEQYLKAAIVHDHYCYQENHVRGWRETHRMFHDALLALGVPWLKAKVMYAAVYLGGPKWVELVPGETCGPNCVFDAISGEAGFIEKEGEALRVRAPQYDEPGFDEALAAIESRIESDPNLSLADIEALVHELKPGDLFYTQDDQHVVSAADDPILTVQ
jgi:hypothetical protein